MDARSPGRVITFYSYKGGTGRSMALANLAWILAAAGKSVLMIDWDLEAPGLHRYFKPFLIDQELGSSDGLMDLIDNFSCQAISPVQGDEPLSADWWQPLADISAYVLPIEFDHFPAEGRIDLLPAGRQTESYAIKVNAFNWQNFYERLGGGGFLDSVKAQAQAQYDYVLIDSRTGVSDTAGICTAQMPDTLVVCFTYNNQSITGAAAVAASARRQQAALERTRAELARRGGSTAHTGVRETLGNAPRPFRVFPVPMRVNTEESDRLALRQALTRASFAQLLDGDLRDELRYWSQVEVPHQGFYAYEELLAAFKDDPHDPKTLLSAYLRMAGYLTDGEVREYALLLQPAYRQQCLEAFAETPQTSTARQAASVAATETDQQAALRYADEALNALTREQREQARGVMCRLVRLGTATEGSGAHAIRVPLSDFNEEQLPLIAILTQHRLLSVITARDQRRTPAQPEQVVALLEERLVAQWELLRRWLQEDREFLLWRQQLRSYSDGWTSTGDHSALLGGTLLSAAQQWLRRRPADLNVAERSFIEASVDESQKPVPDKAVAMPQAAPAPPPAPAGLRPPEASAARSTRRWLMPAALLVALISMLYATLLVDKSSTSVLPKPPGLPSVQVPLLVNTTVDEAQAIAKSLGLSLEMRDDATGAARPDLRDGVVTEQEPAARSAVAEGASLIVKVTTRTATVPLLVGQTVEAAHDQLKSSGLELAIVEPANAAIADFRSWTVIGQVPDPGNRVQWGSKVSVRVAAQDAAALQGFKIGIFFYSDDRRAAELSMRIEAHLRSTRFTGQIYRRPSSAAEMARLYPPKTVEVRYEQGKEEDQARILLSVVGQVGGIGKVVMFSVAGGTPMYLSVFLPQSN